MPKKKLSIKEKIDKNALSICYKNVTLLRRRVFGCCGRFWGGGGDAGLGVVGVRRLGLELSYSFRFRFIWVLGLAHLFLVGFCWYFINFGCFSCFLRKVR